MPGKITEDAEGGVTVGRITNKPIGPLGLDTGQHK